MVEAAVPQRAQSMNRPHSRAQHRSAAGPRPPRISPLLPVLSLLAFCLMVGCRFTNPSPVQGPPVLFTSPPDLPQIMQAVNTSSSRVARLQTNGAELAISGLPTLQTTIALERPSRFRLRAQSLVGTELDMGSNDQLYWLWTKRAEPAAVYYGRHDEFHASQARQILPIPPHWLIEALGIVFFDPVSLHEGPYSTRPELVEIRSQINSPMGPIRKISLIDWQRATVNEQHLYDGQGQRLASVQASNFHFDAGQQVTLPRTVHITLPTANMDFTLNIYGYSINQLTSDAQTLFTMPEIQGVPAIDLARGPAMSTTAQVPPAAAGSGPLRMLPPLTAPPTTRTEVAEKRKLWPFSRIR